VDVAGGRGRDEAAADAPDPDGGPGGVAAEEALAVSRAAAAICRAGDPVGVYRGSSVQVHSPALFIDAIAGYEGEDDVLPVMLWVNSLISGDSEQGPFTMTTIGLAPFGHKELEVIDARSMSFGDLRGWTYDTSNYLLRRGPVFLHGQTCGPSAADKWKTEHTTSKFKKGEQVIRIHIP
jgi:hypothetical protein